MFEKKEFPILEFDCNPKGKIEPLNVVTKIDVPECCVITFFSDVIDDMLQSNRLKQISTFYTATVHLPIYETEYNGEKIAITLGFLGAAGAAAQLEELIAMGFSKFIVCGAAGVLQKGIQVGHLVIPYTAVRDEGVSYHYIEPSREVECNQHAVSIIEKHLQNKNIPYINAKTWTTDAFYRETEDKIALRVSEGCVTVEMEAAAFFAVSKFRNVTLGQVLFGGDDLSGVEWDSRSWNSREEIKKNLVEISFEICLQL
ncbi:nucleoside phosphorylase [Anaeromicropila herbilytica]|uniref:Uridine phosphorylase n=1 Tax=Anaeromicropila herbilytica TaxID=2785025 RepID=A0A7R7EKZ0_9FIRM|nr:nucleoside phosphorylase [Anaeromicropila herbilytica]BCN30955.1 phosphorylase [Anaeromicropila herbilytica]